MTNATDPFDNALLPEFATAQALATFIDSSEEFRSKHDIVVRTLTFLDPRYSKTKTRRCGHRVTVRLMRIWDIRN